MFSKLLIYSRRETLRTCLVGALAVLYISAGIYFQLARQTGTVYPHIAYLPIALAGVWWGWRGLYVAGGLGAVLLLFHLFGMNGAPLWADIIRCGFYVLAAACIGFLGEGIRRRQLALGLAEEKYNMLINKSLTGIGVYRDEKIVFVNNRFAEMLGYQPGQMSGLPIWEIIYQDDRPGIQEVLEKRKKREIADTHYECRFVTRDRNVIWVEVASSPVNYEGSPAVLVNVYNITDRIEAERKRLELSELTQQQEEQLVHSTRLAELGEMAASIAHELNQPLTGIRTFARNTSYMLEQQAGSPEEIKENLRQISDQVGRASKIINQMRELTRRSERRFVLLDVNAIMRENMSFLEPQMKLSSVEVSLDLEPDLPLVMGDQTRLGQVFLNLLTNARQAMEQVEERRLVVKTRLEQRAERRFVTVEINDTGRGFRNEEVEKLFMPFYTTKKAGQGTGLGLSISLTIINDHNGTIEARGVPERGATFVVRLPVAEQLE
jgi:PAS domain S-box-containing protein